MKKLYSIGKESDGFYPVYKHCDGHHADFVANFATKNAAELYITIPELIHALAQLHEWNLQTGTFEAPVWEHARKLLNKLTQGAV